MLKAIGQFPQRLVKRLRRANPGQEVAAHARELTEFLSLMIAKYFGVLTSHQAELFAAEQRDQEALKRRAEEDLRDLLAKGIIHNLGYDAKAGEEVVAWAAYHRLQGAQAYSLHASALFRALPWLLRSYQRAVSLTAYRRVLGAVFIDESGDRWWTPSWPGFQRELSAIAGSLQDVAVRTPLRIFGGRISFPRAVEHSLLQLLDQVEKLRREYALDAQFVLHLDDARIRFFRNVAQANGYVWLPLRPLINAPLSGTDLNRYVRNDAPAERLAQQIVRGDGVTLITGYRGVGKSTLINRALERYLPDAEASQMEAPPWKPIVVSVSLAKTEGVASVLRLTVRRLAETLLGEPTPLTELKLSQVTEENLPRHDIPLMEDERELLSWARTRVAFKVSSQQDASVSSTSGLRAGLGTQLGELLGKKFLSVGFDFSAGKEWQRKLNRTVALLDYDEDRAEEDIIRLIGMLARPRISTDGHQVRLKLVFIFDEMDKMDEKKGQEVLIKQLKNLFLTRNTSFLLVTSKKFYYRWLSARRQEDDVLSSYFSSVIVVPILTSAETRQLVMNLVETGGESLSAYEEAAVDVLARYLTYRAMGVPREIMRELHTMQQWIPHSLQPYFSDSTEQFTTLRVYAEIQRVLETLGADGAHPQDTLAPQSESESAEISNNLDHLQLGEGRREQIQRGRYVVVEELLTQGSIEISEKALSEIYRSNFAMVSSFQDFERLICQLAERLDQFRFSPDEDHPRNADSIGLQFFQFAQVFPEIADAAAVSRLIVLKDFYEITGRPRPPEPVVLTQAETSDDPVRQLEDLLREPDHFKRQLATGLLSRLDRRTHLPSELLDRLYTIFISPNEPEELRVATGAHVTPAVFASNIQRESPSAFIQSETNERVLARFVELCQSLSALPSGTSGISPAEILLSLLERKPTGATRNQLPDSIAAAVVAALAQIRPPDILERVIRSLDPRLGANEGLINDLQVLADGSQHDLLLALVERGFRGISQRTLQQIVRRYDLTQLAELWPKLSKQSYKTLAAESMTAILAVMGNPQASKQNLTSTDLTPIIAWLGGASWGYSDNNVLQAAHKADRRSLYALESAVRQIEDTDQRTRALNRLAVAQGKQAKAPSTTSTAPKQKAPRWWVTLLAILGAIGVLITYFFLLPFDVRPGYATGQMLLDRFIQMMYFVGIPVLLLGLLMVIFASDRSERRSGFIIGVVGLVMSGGGLIIAIWLRGLPFTLGGQLVLFGVLVSVFLVPYSIVRVGNRLTRKR